MTFYPHYGGRYTLPHYGGWWRIYIRIYTHVRSLLMKVCEYSVCTDVTMSSLGVCTPIAGRDIVRGKVLDNRVR